MNNIHRFGISTYAYPFACGNHPEQCPDSPFTHLDFLDKAHALGVTCVQIADNLPLDILDADGLNAVKKRAEEYGILIEVGMKGLDPEKIRQYIDITAGLGSHFLRNVPGISESSPMTIDDVANVLSGFLPLLKEKDIIFAVENHDKFTAAEHEMLMEKLDDPHFRLVLDTTNSLSIEEPIDRIIAHMAKYCACLHLKDYQINRFNRGRGLQITGACPGTGRLDIRRVLNEIDSRSPYDFNVILESWMTPLETLSETLKQEDDWVRAGLAYQED